MKKIISILLIIFSFASCNDKEKEYETFNYTNRLDSTINEINKVRIDLKNLKQDIIVLISDTESVRNWNEDIDVLIGQPEYLNSRLRDLSTLLIMQADSLPFFVADTLNSKLIKNYNEQENTSVLLSHGVGKITESYLFWFDKIFSTARSNKNSKRPQFVNKIKLLSFWETEKANIKTLGDYEIIEHTLHLKAMNVVKELLTEYKAIWSELKNNRLSFNDYFHRPIIERPYERKDNYNGWIQLYSV